MAHAYPRDLAQFVYDRLEGRSVACDLPSLTHVLSAAYQASLLREEERPLTFRLLLAPPESLPLEDGPPGGHHRFRFQDARRLDEQEIRRLAPAAKMQRAMLGVGGVGSGGLHIWGLVHTGPGWLRAMQGGRGRHAPLPPALSVTVTGPGRLSVSHGDTTLGKLAGGYIAERSHDVFESRWLPDACAEVRRELYDARGSAEVAAPVDPDLLRRTDQQLVRRVVAAIRLARHGGTLILLPQAQAEEVVRTGVPIAIKYRFGDEEPRRRYRSLQLRLLEVLAQDAARHGRAPDWESFRTSTEPEVAALDDALLELAHTIAGLADVDGAVVLSKRFEVMGFGGEIVGELPDVPRVMRALDLEGEAREEESTDGVGTRHRSLYRLCGALPEALGIVLSQDGGVRLVAKKDGAVTYWDELGTGPMEI